MCKKDVLEYLKQWIYITIIRVRIPITNNIMMLNICEVVITIWPVVMIRSLHVHVDSSARPHYACMRAGHIYLMVKVRHVHLSSIPLIRGNLTSSVT